jgi:hypothetical protein
VSVRREWIDRAVGKGAGGLAVRRQCELAGVVRSRVYAPRAEDVLDELDLELLRLIDAEYTRRPFYGSRRTTASDFSYRSVSLADLAVDNAVILRRTLVVRD